MFIYKFQKKILKKKGLNGWDYLVKILSRSPFLTWDISSPLTSANSLSTSFCLADNFLGTTTCTLTYKFPFPDQLRLLIPSPLNLNVLPLCVPAGILTEHKYPMVDLTIPEKVQRPPRPARVQGQKTKTTIKTNKKKKLLFY